MCSSSRSLFLALFHSLPFSVYLPFCFSVVPSSSRPFISLALVTRGYLSFYTPDGQVLLPLHARTPSAIISSARRCGLFSSLIRTNAGSRFHQSRLFLFLSFSLAHSLFLSTSLIIKNQRLLKVRSPLAIAVPSNRPFVCFLYLHPRRNLQFEILCSRTKKEPVLSRDAGTKTRVGSLSTSSEKIIKKRQKYFARCAGQSRNFFRDLYDTGVISFV